MNEVEFSPRVDSVLLPFLCAPDEAEANRHLDALIANATPGIAKITRSSRTPEDAFQEATHRVVKQLREFRTQGKGNLIGNYPHYVNVVASRVVKGQIRQEHPRHRSLVDSLRHVLRREPSIASWQADGRKLCGFARWRDESNDRLRSHRLTQLLEEPRSFEEVHGMQSAATLNHVDLLTRLFAWIGHPFTFSELAKIVCGLKRVEDLAPVTDGERAGRGLSEWLPDNRKRPDEQVEWKEFLSRLWRQIEQLPRLHRLAYLLNFTAADGQLELFWTYGVTTIRRIGACLQISDEQFQRLWKASSLDDRLKARARDACSYDEQFALLWQMLPLPDAIVGQMLGTERQKVINLRRAAADRLSRQMTRDRRPAHALA
jgi:hypothetical protein